MKTGKVICLLLCLVFSLCIGGCSSPKQEMRSPEKEFSESKETVVEVKEQSIEESSEPEKEPVDLSLCTVTVKDKIYQEKFTEPYIRVEYNGLVLVKDKDYSLRYESREDKKSGHYKCTLEMTGDYTGTKEIEYNVRPVGATVSQLDSKVHSITLQWNDRSEICDGYEIEYRNTSENDAYKTIKIEDRTTTEYKMEDLNENSSFNVRIRTYKQTDDGSVLYSPWSKTCNAQTKKVENINGVTYIDGVLVVNKTYSLPSDYGNGMDNEAMEAYYKMYYDAASEGLYLNIISGYRSYWVQDSVYNSFVYDRGVEAADKVSARPGHSEHQTGLAMDINSTWFTFADTAEGIWLKNNCANYGFIIRYPEGKEEITGYAYESWHIRYVGTELAQKLTSEGITLEEYFGITSYYS